MILCIDPGLRGLGIAAFSMEGELTSASYVRNPTEGRGYKAHADLAQAAWRWWDGPTPNHLIIEHPRVYPGMSEKDPNDLLDVVAVGSACAVLFGAEKLHTVMPSEWKGNVKKDVMTERIRSKLSPYELGRVEGPKHLIHNALDAAGIGLWHFKRLTARVYPGATP